MSSISEFLSRLRERTGWRTEPAARSIPRRSVASEPRLVPFYGIGRADRIRLGGRVTDETRLIPSELADTRWKNVRNLYQRFGASRLQGVRVRADWSGTAFDTVSDADGFFRFDFVPPTAVGLAEWHEVPLALPDLAAKSSEPIRPQGLVYVPAASARFGVISDLDDTVIKTNVASRARMLANVAFRNARTRIPFPGVAALYRALREGIRGAEHNPLFYVSSCPWNLFDLIVEFFRIHDIPLGPMLLKDYRLKTLLFPGAPDIHKLSRLRAILEFYPELGFVLIGDSGERDPEIYAEIVRAFPGRVQTIYIRKIRGRRRRVDGAFEAMAAELKTLGCDLVLIENSLQAARHAIDTGLIDDAAYREVRIGRRSDAETPPEE